MSTHQLLGKAGPAHFKLSNIAGTNSKSPLELRYRRGSAQLLLYEALQARMPSGVSSQEEYDQEYDPLGPLSPKRAAVAITTPSCSCT